MGTIIDEKGLVRNAEAAVWCGERVWDHVHSEFTNDIDKVMSTVARGVPIQYAIPRVGPSGELIMVTITTLDGALQHYRAVRDAHDIVDWQAFVELRSDWCVFFDGVVTHRDAGCGDMSRGRSVVFFVLSDQDGITGELAWPCMSVVPSGPSGNGAHTSTGREATVPQTRLDNLALHATYLDALQRNDAGALLAMMTDDLQVGIRSYVGDVPAFVEMHSKDELRRHYEAFFARHRVRDVSIVNLVADDWYVYSELLWEAAVTDQPRSDVVKFRTAEVLVLDGHGGVRARMGYGTDPV